MPAKPQIIADPQTNRGTAFTVDERKRFGLMGRLPAAVETLEQQAARAYKQVCRLDDDLDKYIYLEQLHDAMRRCTTRSSSTTSPNSYPSSTIRRSARPSRSGPQTTAARVPSICPWIESRMCGPRLKASASALMMSTFWSCPTQNRSSASATGV